MPEDNIDPTKIPFNTLNDVSQAIGGSRERITAGVDFMDAIANAASNQFVSDSLIGTGPYKAIVLRVEKDDKTAEAGSWLSNTLSSFFGDAPKIVKIKARIPEIHAALPIPEQTGDAEGPHQPIIDLYPTFIAQDTQVEAPKPGDIVNVDFGNKNTYSDPIYLGPLIKTALTPGAAGGIGGAGAFGNCGASSPIPATPAAQPSASESVGVIQDGSQPVYANPPEYVAGYGISLTKNAVDAANLLKNLGDKDESQYPLGSVYVFGDSQTNGMTDAILQYFSGFDIKFNNWYGGAYKIAYKDVPKDKVKGKNQGKSIESYMDDFKLGDTVIVSSIGGNASFGARKKYPLVGEAITSDPYLVNLPEKLPTTEDEGFSLFEDTSESIAFKYGLGEIIQNGEDHAYSFQKFCDILNTIKGKGVNVIIFGLPYGGVESRQEDRVHFDYVQFASLAIEGLGENYVSVMQDSKGLKAGDDDVHYFTGNGGGGYKSYFETLLNPTLTAFYYTYKDIIKGLLEYARANTPEVIDILDVQAALISLPGEEKPENGVLESLGSMLELAGPSPSPVQPTSPSVPASACIGTVGGFGSGGASAGKSFGVDPTPFNGGKEGVIIINGNEYPLAKAKGSQQFKGRSRKGVPTFVVIHNSAGSGGEEGVFKSLLSKGYGTHFTIGLDGTIYQHADPIAQILSHASGLNNDSIGIETPAPYKWKTAGAVQKEAGYTNAGTSTWYGSSVFAIPPQQMIDSMNQLLATLSSKIPSITPFLSTFPDNYIGPEKLKKRKTDFGVKMYNKGGSWSHPKPDFKQWGGSIISHRDWVAKADGRYFLEKFYEYYTGNKLDGIFK